MSLFKKEKLIFNLFSKRSKGSLSNISDIFITPGVKYPKDLKDVNKGNAEQLTSLNLIYKHNSGFYSLLPFLYKSYSKLVTELENEMNSIGGQKILLPSLYKTDLLKKSQRFEDLKNEIYLVNSRKNEFYLAPTHEEVLASLLSKSTDHNHKFLPLLFYQIDSKFRNELRPRYGLLRSNQFIMKDLYSFDKNQECAFETYEKVCLSYEKFFNKIDLRYVKVKASNGLMGGNFSHEFHLISSNGDDEIYLCKDCSLWFNKELLTSEKDHSCPECKSEMKSERSIEIGHTFYLGTKYTEKLEAYFYENQKKNLLEMCSFGIGVTRILSAFISQSESIEISWPVKIAPYHVLIIPPKRGSKENLDGIGDKIAINIGECLKEKGFDVLIDNRSNLTIGKRLIDSIVYGFPYKIILGKKLVSDIPKFELHFKNDISLLSHSELINEFEILRKKI